jgi:hypothetical protein
MVASPMIPVHRKHKWEICNPGLPRHKVSPCIKTKQNKIVYGCGSSDRVPTYQVQGPEFNRHNHKKVNCLFFSFFKHHLKIQAILHNAYTLR